MRRDYILAKIVAGIALLQTPHRQRCAACLLQAVTRCFHAKATFSRLCANIVILQQGIRMIRVEEERHHAAYLIQAGIPTTAKIEENVAAIEKVFQLVSAEAPIGAKRIASSYGDKRTASTTLIHGVIKQKGIRLAEAEALY